MSDTSGYSLNPQGGRDAIVQALMGIQNPPPGGAVDPTRGGSPSLPGTDLTAGPTSGGVNPMAPTLPSYAGAPGNLPMGRPSPTPPLQPPPGAFGSQPQGSSMGMLAPGQDQSSLLNRIQGLAGTTVPGQPPLLSRASPPPLALPGQIQHY